MSGGGDIHAEREIDWIRLLRQGRTVEGERGGREEMGEFVICLADYLATDSSICFFSFYCFFIVFFFWFLEVKTSGAVRLACS